ncbi:YkvA family protein [Hymenobacter sp. GOD-10R]|uniref:YkvA family protein n=1 Tax=Hymenobacter sp. GOD-10R TaxID=3093922 RepID=UPI003A5CAC8E
MDTQNPKGDQIASSPLFKKFLGKAEEYLKKPTRIKQLLSDAYEKASEKKDIGSIAQEAWETMQTLFRLIKLSASGEYTGLPTSTVVAAVAVTIYFLFPIDLIPDFIPVLGLLDDVALVAWFSTSIKEELDKFTEWEKTRPTVVEPSDMVPSAAVVLNTGQDGSTHNSGPQPQDANPTPFGHDLHGQVSTESSKRHSTTDLKPSEAPVSNTDSGISSPDSSNPNPSLTGPDDTEPAANPKPHADDIYNTDGSRTPNDGSNDAGGNVR